jgi:hypothetical protein
MLGHVHRSEHNGFRTEYFYRHHRALRTICDYAGKFLFGNAADPQFFDPAGTGQSGDVALKSSSFSGGMIESIVGIGETFAKLISMASAAIFSIHTLCSPYFGDFNSWVLEAMVDIILAIGLFQIVTGRSMKGIE